MQIILPVDVKVTREFEDSSNNRIANIEEIIADEMGLDIGPNTVDLFKNELKESKTIFWNGTLGYSEYENYKDGTVSILDYITSIDSNVVLGGGDTVAASKVFGYKDKVTFASTGGGATLEYISGKILPGIECIDNKE